MVKCGLNGRPVYENDEIKVSYRRIPSKRTHSVPKIKKQCLITIVNNGEIIDKNMEINVLGRLLNKKGHPISNAEIKVIENHRIIRTLKTSSEGYFIFYGGYFTRYHSFIFSFKGNKKYKSSTKSLVIT